MRYRSANVFGILGYMSVVIQWLWFSVTLLFPLISLLGLSNLFMPPSNQHAQPNTPAQAIDLPSPIEGLFVILAIIFTIGICLYAIFAVPRTIGKLGKAVTHRSAAVAIPHITHHREVTARKRKKLIEYITWSIKILLVVIPLCALLAPTPTSVGLEHAIVLVVGLGSGVWSCLMFGIQYLVVKIRHIDPEYVW